MDFSHREKNNVSMSEMCSMSIGGKADIVIKPETEEELQKAILFYNQKQIPMFILGNGTNVVVSDKGIRGVVIDTKNLKKNIVDNEKLIVGSGCDMSDTCLFALENELSGLEFIHGMPGTVGGAVYMNARCFGSEISNILNQVEGFDMLTGEPFTYTVNKNDFSYKISPFQDGSKVMTNISFKLSKGDKLKIKEEMDKNKNTRKEKGHYEFPCAGSMFKNNTNFGKPTGQIIDDAGLRGFSIGDAQIAPFHGNIFINKGKATGEDMRKLKEYTQEKVKEKFGYELEPEVLFIGDW